MTYTTDILIIGGGIHGASLAFHLAERGVKATVLERQFIGAGATGRSSGLVRMHYDTEVDSRLAWESFQYFRNWKERVGGESTYSVDVRLIAATHQPLEQMIERGTFRSDLYYRLNIFPITLPPLRERLAD
ncbi:MAG TPA: FAD-dependent oxidoreductase, partial [Anaerolineales bacterium]|nr:FAD-dependent oxidoreductase [Anaerolineales bacterium]